MLESFFPDFITDLNTTFSNPQKRVFIGYLLSSLLLAIAWLVIQQRQSLKHALQILFNKKVWSSKSALADYKLFIFNKAIAILISPILLSHLATATVLFFWLHDLFPSRPSLLQQYAPWVSSLLFTFTYFILDDFARFYVHRLMHRWPILWVFHKVHHSAESMTPITVFRTHPVEMVLFSLRSSIVQAICIAGFVFFMGNNISLTSILGANIFVFFFNALGSNLRHSHVAIYYWRPLEKWLISPAQHQIHHSIEQRHYDKNFGVVLAVWDRLFGSLHHSEKNHQLSFGLSQQTVTQHQFINLYWQPFLEALTIIKNRITRLSNLIRKPFNLSHRANTNS